MDERVRQARRDIDQVIDQLKERSEALAEKASLRAADVNTGESGAARAEAREASSGSSRICDRAGASRLAANRHRRQRSEPVVGARCRRRTGHGGHVVDRGQQAEIDVRGKRIRANEGFARVRGSPSQTSPKVRVTVDLRPRNGC